MKINEPKTPYAQRYDPTEDEEELHALDAQELMVDELDQAREMKHNKLGRTSDIPGLELGEPAEDLPESNGEETKPVVEGVAMQRSNSGREKQVVVDKGQDEAAHGEDEEVGMSKEEKEKHRQFEERRKKHYEMRDVKGLLGYVFTSLMDPRARALESL